MSNNRARHPERRGSMKPKTRFETAVPTNPEDNGWPTVGQAIESGEILIANELMICVSRTASRSIYLP